MAEILEANARFVMLLFLPSAFNVTPISTLIADFILSSAKTLGLKSVPTDVFGARDDGINLRTAVETQVTLRQLEKMMLRIALVFGLRVGKHRVGQPRGITSSFYSLTGLLDR